MLKNRFKEYMEKQLEVKENKTEFKAKVIKYVDLVFMDNNTYTIMCKNGVEKLPETLTQVFLKMFETEINKKLTFDNVYEIINNYCQNKQIKTQKILM